MEIYSTFMHNRAYGLTFIEYSKINTNKFYYKYRLGYYEADESYKLKLEAESLSLINYVLVDSNEDVL